MKILLFALFFLLLDFLPKVRCALFYLPLTIGHLPVDLFNYVRYCQWRNAPSGQLVCYCGLFGKGKTLSCVHRVLSLYRHFDNKRVYDMFRHKWVTQRVVIVSNVSLAVPFIQFESLRQLVSLTESSRLSDSVNDTITFIYVIGDEFSVQMNSRNFKSNIDAQFLNTLLTCRHHHLSIYYTSQRFNHVDALLRQVTQTVYQCDKLWRLQQLDEYNAYELENCTNPLLVQPLSRSCWFVRNSDYNAYDTLACVSNLEHSALTGDMITDVEILQKQNVNPDADTVVHTSRKAKRRKFHRS